MTRGAAGSLHVPDMTVTAKNTSDSASAAGSRGGFAAGALISSAVCLLALPSAVLAFTVKFEPGVNSSAAGEAARMLGNGQPTGGLARDFPVRSLAKGTLYPFTPASSPTRPDRSVTVAVRIDPEAARALTVRGQPRNVGAGAVELGIAPTAFNLGVSRGYTNFAQNIAHKEEKPAPGMADLEKFSIAKRPASAESRFSPRIVIDETQSGGRAPRTFAGDSDDLVDVGGSYRLTKNLNVTAGVRYSQERERLLPVADGKQDSQAVYVGTQFRF